MGYSIELTDKKDGKFHLIDDVKVFHADHRSQKDRIFISGTRAIETRAGEEAQFFFECENLKVRHSSGEVIKEHRVAEEENKTAVVQWFRNGDHPLDYSQPYEGFEDGSIRVFTAEERMLNNWEGDIVRYYRSPDIDGQSTCKHCGKIMHDHGWIDTPGGGHVVCPGDWIIPGRAGEYYPCKNPPGKTGAVTSSTL